ncbi:hypothetical protein J3Q64DRAFT_1704544 [Phycomyces blakesleeanus]|uniref:Uncharacterized protein n=1 Tax=Phycomyces blakesleeanus TaxID=4837 RepID=A0ABR3AID3_PHYBL
MFSSNTKSLKSYCPSLDKSSALARVAKGLEILLYLARLASYSKLEKLTLNSSLLSPDVWVIRLLLFILIRGFFKTIVWTMQCQNFNSKSRIEALEATVAELRAQINSSQANQKDISKVTQDIEKSGIDSRRRTCLFTALAIKSALQIHCTGDDLQASVQMYHAAAEISCRVIKKAFAICIGNGDKIPVRGDLTAIQKRSLLKNFE